MLIAEVVGTLDEGSVSVRVTVEVGVGSVAVMVSRISVPSKTVLVMVAVLEGVDELNVVEDDGGTAVVVVMSGGDEVLVDIRVVEISGVVG